MIDQTTAAGNTGPAMGVGALPELGIVEGFFGPRWSWAERRAVVERLAPAGYRFYHYAPKGDAHLRRDWRTPHPEAEAREIADFATFCRAGGMRFGVGLTPYALHDDFDAAGRSALMERVTALDAMGIDDLAILFDDMRGELPDLAARQAAIVACAAERTRATRIYTCPSYYSDDRVLDRVFGQRPAGYLEALGRGLDAAVQVYWTGEEVCSREIGPAHLAEVAERLGRRVCLWDNYPVNDGPRMSDLLHLRAFTGRAAANAPLLTGHAINPALQPILSCIPALTLPMLYRQGACYRYMEAFRIAAGNIVGSDLAAMLERDLLSFADGGRSRLGERLPPIRQRYADLSQHGTHEVLKWLDGGYATSAEDVQTQ